MGGVSKLPITINIVSVYVLVKCLGKEEKQKHCLDQIESKWQNGRRRGWHSLGGESPIDTPLGNPYEWTVRSIYRRRHAHTQLTINNNYCITITKSFWSGGFGSGHCVINNWITITNIIRQPLITLSTARSPTICQISARAIKPTQPTAKRPVYLTLKKRVKFSCCYQLKLITLKLLLAITQ